MQELEWIAGLLGCIGSLIAAWPMLSDTTARRHWAKLNELAARSEGEARAGWEQARDAFLNERLGNYPLHRRCALTGFGLLGLAFLLLFIAGLIAR